ncbi:hypothetical protein HMPREF1423_00418 [Helicobacter pylori GAM270ASi]|nr:hypothetical protein HMPREF1423_00418 [Helicobacter pylori GAM270ASi]
MFLDKTIKEVVDELNGRYFLPDIQREYVWLQNADGKKIEQLFDSILRGYPIGSFLFWKLPKEDIAKSDEQDSDKLNFQAGLEPARHCYREILSPLHLPILPLGQSKL